MNPKRSKNGVRVMALLAILLLSACVTGPVSESGTPISEETLQKARQSVQDQKIPSELQGFYVALYSQWEQNYVLHAMRGGLAAMRLGYFDLAERTFDEAIQRVESLQEGAAQAERAKSKFVPEQEKWFKGENYERSALYFYRGLLYLRRQDFGNAAACFKRAELQDIVGDDAPRAAGDWVSAELGLAVASYRNGFPQDAEEALKRAEASPGKQGTVPLPPPDANVLVVIETGRGPIKYRAGQYGEKLMFQEEVPTDRSVALVSNGRTILQSAPAENLYFQATTRGTRQVDYILDGKAAFKEGTAAATAGLATGAIAASHADRSGVSSGILGLLALGTAIASSATHPEADIRSWYNLPHSIYLLAYKAKPGETSLEVQALDATGQPVHRLTLTLDPAKLADGSLQVFWVNFETQPASNSNPHLP